MSGTRDRKTLSKSVLLSDTTTLPSLQLAVRALRGELGLVRSCSVSLTGIYGSRAGGSQVGKCRDGLQQREHALDCYVPALALVLRD